MDRAYGTHGVDFTQKSFWKFGNVGIYGKVTLKFIIHAS
jgi:hypothetical protein